MLSYNIRAAMSLSPSRQSNGSAESENDVQSIHNDRNHRMSGEGFSECSRDQIQEEQRREDGSEDREMDTLWVTAALSFQSTNQTEQDDCEGELKCPKA